VQALDLVLLALWFIGDMTLNKKSLSMFILENL